MHPSSSRMLTTTRRGGGGPGLLWFLLTFFILMLQINTSFAFNSTPHVQQRTYIQKADLFRMSVNNNASTTSGHEFMIKQHQVKRSSKLRIARLVASSITTRRQTVSTATKLSITAGAYISLVSYLSYILGWTWNAKQILALIPLGSLLIFFTGGELFARKIANVAFMQNYKPEHILIKR